MQLAGKHKLGAILAATALLAVAVGVAQGSDWTEYTGTIESRSAYLLGVADGAERVQIRFAPSEADGADPGAAFALYDGLDRFVGYYELDSQWKTADVLVKGSGAYVLFVHDLKDGALAVAQKGRAQTTADLVRLEVKYDFTPIAESDGGSGFKTIASFNADDVPKAAAIEYTGDATNFRSELSSSEGVVHTAIDEYGRASEPGAWTEWKGERHTTPANLASGQYDARISADSFQGTVFVVTASYERPDLDSVDADEVRPHVAPGPGFEGAKIYGTLPHANTAYAFDVVEGADELVIATHSWDAVVRLIGPHDSSSQLVRLDGRDSPVVKVKISSPGEWVIVEDARHFGYSNQPHGVILGVTGAAPAVAQLRELGFRTGAANVTLNDDWSPALGRAATGEFKLPAAPLDFLVGGAGVSVQHRVAISSQKGDVCWSHAELVFGGAYWSDGGYCRPVDFENWIAGAYKIVAENTLSMPDHVEVKWTTYDRHVVKNVVNGPAAKEPDCPDEPEEAPKAPE